MSSFVEKNPDFVLKLKIKATDGQTQIRRVRLPRIADGEGNVSYEELVGLVVVFSVPETSAADSGKYNVSLTYYDVDGDSVTIASSEELVDACEQYVGQKVLRITTYVKPNTTVTTDKKSPPPASVDRGTSTNSSSPPHPIQIHDVLESFVGVLSTAVNHLQEGLAAKTSKNPMPSVRRATENKSAEAVEESVSEEVKVADEPKDADADKHEEDTEESGEKQKPAAEPSPEEEVETRPFIHGRHTCDSCLATPIIGTRYHSTNLKDYDLCENCHGNYKGKEIVFEPAELDRDRDAQDRWYRRWENSRGLRRGRFVGRGNGRRGQRFGGRMGMKQGRAGRFSAGPPPPPPPPPGVPCPPPPPPPPHHRPPFVPPHIGPGGFHHPHQWAHVGPHAAPHMECHANSIVAEFDNALKEAIRRSLSDIAPKESKINEQKDEKTQPSAPVAAAIKSSPVPVVETANVDEKGEAALSDIPRSVEIVVDDSKTEESTTDENGCAEEAEAMEKSMDDTESVDSEKLAADEEIAVSAPSPSKSNSSSRKISESSKDESFASDAKGSGDVAEAMGAALDAVVDVIREMQAETGADNASTQSEAVATSGNNEGGDLILDSTELLEKANNTDDDSEWSVVKSVGSNGTTESEQIAKAAEMLGSALYNSDMKNSSTENSGEESSSFSVPSSVPTDIGTQQSNAVAVAPAQIERWAAYLLQLRELGFDNEADCVEVLERLEAANIGVDEDDDVSINHVVNELLEKKK